MMKPRARIALFLVALLLLSVTSLRTAQATAIEKDGRVDADQVIDDDLFLNEDQVEMDGTVNGALITFATTAIIRGEVNGDLIALVRDIIIEPGAVINGNLFVGGQSAHVAGTVTGSVFVGSAELNLAPGAKVGSNLYTGLYSLTLEPGSVVGRDVFAAGYQAIIKGDAQRDVNFSGGALELAGTVGRNLTVDLGDSSEGNPYFFMMYNGQNDMPPALQPGLRITEDASIGDTLTYTSSVPYDSAIQTNPPGGIVYQTPAPRNYQAGPAGQPAPPQPLTVRFPILATLFNFLRDLVTLLVFGAIVLLLLPKILNKVVDQASERPAPAALYGILTIAGGYLGALLGIAAVLALGLLFSMLTLGGLSIPVFGLGFSTMALLAALFTLLVSVGSKLVVAYCIGQTLVKRVAPQVARKELWALVSGAVILALVSLIPIVGWIISIASVLIGMGAMWLAWKAWKKPPATEPVLLPENS